MEKNLKDKNYGHIMLNGVIYSLTNDNPSTENPCNLCDLKDECSDIGLETQLCKLFNADDTEYFKSTAYMIGDVNLRGSMAFNE